MKRHLILGLAFLLLLTNNVNAQTSGKGLMASMGKPPKVLKQDYTNFCRYMTDNDYRRAFRHLRDHHKQRLETHYTEITCTGYSPHSPPMPFATIGQAGTALYAMIRYLKQFGKKHNKDYLAMYINYVAPIDPSDISYIRRNEVRSLLDVAQHAIDTAAGLEEDAESTYQHLKKNGAKHSYYFCKKRNLDTRNCLAP